VQTPAIKELQQNKSLFHYSFILLLLVCM